MHLYILDVDTMEDPCNRPDWEGKMMKERWDRIMRYPGLGDRQAGAGAGLLLRYVFYREGIPFLGDSFSVGIHGKPYHQDLCFNLSHSGKYVICVTGKEEVGCDIQKIKPVHDRIVNRYFSEEEQRDIRTAKESEKDELFTKIWALKESYLKMTGEGLTRDLKEISFHVSDSIRIFDKMEEKSVHFIEKKLEDYIIVVCGMDQEISVEYVHPHIIDKCL